MTNPFTAFAFEASGTNVNTSRTMPARLEDIINVKDYGATGNGVTDDLAAINAAFAWTANNNRGTIFFPPGTYYVSGPIDVGSSNDNINFVLSGVMGGSTITGNFSDYIIKRDSLTDSGAAGCHVIEGLAIVNTHATGAGIQLGLCVGGAIRDCTVTAFKGISTGNTDDLGSLEITIKNCQLIGPGSSVSGSIGLMMLADGPAIGCYIEGFEKGAVCWGNEGGQMLYGCRFESCAIGVEPGANQSGGSGPVDGGPIVGGSSFKNCGTAILETQGSDSYIGVHIEGTNGTLPGPSNPQYGFNFPQGKSTGCFIAGVAVTGQYDQFGLYFQGDSISTPDRASVFGVGSVNSGSGHAWGSGLTPVADMSHAPFVSLIGCNIAQVSPLVNRILFVSPISSATWLASSIWSLKTLVGGSGYVPGTYGNVPLTGGSGSGAISEQVIVDGSGTVVAVKTVSATTALATLPNGTGYAVNNTLSASNSNLGGSGSGFSVTVASVQDTAYVTWAFGSLGQQVGDIFTAVVTGVTISGYNGTFSTAIISDSTVVAYPAAGPLANPTINTGNLTINVFNNLEGDVFNINDSDSSTWSNVVLGNSSGHAKVRYNGAGGSLTVEGI